MMFSIFIKHIISYIRLSSTLMKNITIFFPPERGNHIFPQKKEQVTLLFFTVIAYPLTASLRGTQNFACLSC